MKAAPTPAPSAQRYQTPTPSLPSRLPERNLNTCRHAALARGRGGAPGTGRGSTACKVAASENVGDQRADGCHIPPKLIAVRATVQPWHNLGPPTANNRSCAQGKATKIAPWRSVKPADSRESPFKDLELMELWDGVGGRTGQLGEVHVLPYAWPAAQGTWRLVSAGGIVRALRPGLDLQLQGLQSKAPLFPC